jgi:uncharacterized membrane protein YphA (DoxX/SURF4 family)
MRWAVATVALSDIVRAERDVAVSWPEIGAVVARWLEDFGRSTGQWKTHTEAALRMSNMGSEAPPGFDSQPPQGFDRVDRMFSLHVQRYGSSALRVLVGVVFVWFGTLTLFGSSPTDYLVVRALPFISPRFAALLVGLWEVATGVGLLYRPLVRVAALLLSLQLLTTVLTLILLRDICFTHFPHALTLEGQYLVTNIALVGAAIVVASSVRRGGSPVQKQRATS